LFYEAGRAVASSDRVCIDDASCMDVRQRCKAGRCRAVARVVAMTPLASLASPSAPRTVVADGARIESASARRPTDERLFGDVSAVFSPGIASIETRAGEKLLLLFHTAIGVDSPGGAANRSLALSVARAGGADGGATLDFVPYAYNPVLARLLLFTQPLGESGAAPLVEGGALRVFFDATTTDGASAPPGVASSSP